MPLPQILPCPCLGVVLFKDILYVVSFACSFLNGENGWFFCFLVFFFFFSDTLPPKRLSVWICVFCVRLIS